MKRLYMCMIVFSTVLCMTACADGAANISDSETKEFCVGPEYAYSLDLNGSDVVAMVSNCDSSIDLSSYDNILNACTDIIYGTVKSVENYNGYGGTAWIKENVEIIDTYKGEMEVGSTICVVEQTGYITANDFINSYLPEDRANIRNTIMENIPDSKLDSTVIDQTQGIPLDKVGDRIIFCLWKSPQSTEDCTYYEPVGDWAGKQIQMENDTFAQYYPMINDAGERVSPHNYTERTQPEIMKLLHIKN